MIFFGTTKVQQKIVEDKIDIFARLWTLCFRVSYGVMAVKSTYDNKYDMLTNKNLKFLFYHFKNDLDRQVWPTERVIGTPLLLKMSLVS